MRGTTIRAGEQVALYFASANRDEEVFDDPFAFRVDRRPNPHLAFGFGEHFCMGAHVARVELETIFRHLLARLESFEVVGTGRAPELDRQRQHQAPAAQLQHDVRISLTIRTERSDEHDPGDDTHRWRTRIGSSSGASGSKPSSDATIDVIDSGTEELYYTIAAAAPDDMTRAVAAARQAFDEGPWPRLTHAERAEYIRALGAALEERSDVLAQLWPRESGVLYKTSQYAGRHRLGCARVVRRAGRHVPVRGGVPADERRRVRPARARAGRRRRRDHPVERAGRAHLPQDRSRAARGLHGRAQVVARGAGRGLRVRGGRPSRSACRPGVLNVVTADREVSELLVTRPAASTRSRSRARPRPAGASRRCAASGSPAARSSSAGSRRRSILDDMDLGDRGQDARTRRVRAQRPGVLVADARSS